MSRTQHNPRQEPVFEAMEDRLLLSLLGVEPDYPQIWYDSGTKIGLEYHADTDLFSAGQNVNPSGVFLDLFTYLEITGTADYPKAFQLNIHVDQTGRLVGGVTGDDLLIQGVIDADVDLDGDGLPDHSYSYSGVLLTAEVLKFGFANDGTGSRGTADLYDFRFRITGGLLAKGTEPLFSVGGDIGVYMESLVGRGSTFDGNFDSDFQGPAQGLLGPILPAPLGPKIVIEKYVAQCGTEGLTPGFWKQCQHFQYWTGYTKYQRYNDVFGVEDSSCLTLLGALERGGGGAAALGRHAVAALLNAASPNIDYAYTEAQIIAMVQSAYATGGFETVKDLLEAENQKEGCITSPEPACQWEDADEPTGPVVDVGDWVRFRYVVRNPNSDVSLSDVKVLDDNETPGNTSDDFAPIPVLVGGYNVGDVNGDGILDPEEEWIYISSKTVEPGQHKNIATVTGTPPTGAPVTDEDAANWLGRSAPLASLGDFVWHDQYHSACHLVDGIQDVGEPGIADVTLNLLNATGTAILATTTTDGDGFYHFTGLAAGTYIVEVAAENFASGGVLEGWYPTLRDRDGDTLDSDGSLYQPFRSPAVILAAGEDNPTIDFGFFKTCVGLVKTGPQDAHAGDTIKYHFLVVNCGDVVLHGGAQVYDQMLSSCGAPIWSGVLQPGQVVEFDRCYTIPAYKCGCGGGDTLVNTATAIGHPIRPDGYALPNVTYVATWTVDLVTYSPPAGKLSGLVYDDLNNNGKADAGEPGIEGVTVTLRDGYCKVVATTVTSSDGTYSFTGLASGTYTIVEGQEAVEALAYADGEETIGSIGGWKSGNDKITVTVRPGDVGKGYNFGEIAESAILGFVWNDVNGNGEPDSGEPPIPGVTVRLTGTNDRGEAVNLTTTTDEDGIYIFTNLRPSNGTGYTVEELQPAGFSDGQAVVGTINGAPVGAAVTSNKIQKIMLRAGQDGEDYNFADRQPQSGGCSLTKGQTAKISFWNSRKGQCLILSLNGGQYARNLGNWLAQTFPNLYGRCAGTNNLAGMTNKQVLAFYQSLFKTYKKCCKRGSGLDGNLDPQVMALALSAYVTNESLAGTIAQKYGFVTSAGGTGAATFDIDAALGAGSAQKLFGNGTLPVLSVLEILKKTDALSSKGLLFDTDGNRRISLAEAFLRDLACDLFTTINEAGSIRC